MKPFPGSIAMLAGLGLAGCAGVNNDRVVGLDPGVPMAEATAPSVIGADRANWRRREYIVWTDAPEHWPIYTALRPVSSDSNPAQTGASPTAAGAFEWENDMGAQATDGVAAPFIAGWEVLTMPVAMIFRWPGLAVSDDPAWFDRYNEPPAADDPAAPDALPASITPTDAADESEWSVEP